MSFGLSDDDLSYIVSTIVEFDEIQHASIFGSRAKGNAKAGSDIDLAIFGENITFDTISKLHALLEDESPMPYRFDIVDYSHLSHENLKEHIDRIGVCIFERSSLSPDRGAKGTISLKAH